MNASFPQSALALAARAQVRQVSAAASRGHTRPAYLLRLLCPWVMRGDYPLGAPARRWLRSVVLRSPLGPWYALTGPGAFRAQICTPVQFTYLWPRNWR